MITPRIQNLLNLH